MTDRSFNQPLGGNDMPRFAGPATMMRLPSQTTAEGLDVCFVGVPIDIGSSNRSGTRHGPRQIRAESCMIRPYNMATRAKPFESLQVADIGDVAINTFDLKKTVGIIEKAYDGILAHNCIPLTLGGDHTLTLPILRAMKKKHGPVALIHIDAHADINDEMFGEKIAHGTPFRRAVEEGLIDPKRYCLIGIRGTAYGREDWDFAAANGIRIIPIAEFHARGAEDVMAEAREIVGTGPVYVTYDIDFVDPTFAPGTGTPEVGGPNSWQALQVARGLRGLDVVGADLVEVSPPFDPAGGTAWLGISLMFEMLCVMAEQVAKRRAG